MLVPNTEAYNLPRPIVTFNAILNLGRIMVSGFFRNLLDRLMGRQQSFAVHLDALSNHIDAILGEATHLHELVSPDGLHIDVLHYPPAGDRDFHYLVTSGASDQPMTGCPAGHRFELTLALPASWDVSNDGFKDPATFAPIQLLKMMARYPHHNETYFIKRDSIDINWDTQFAPMTALLLMPPVLVPELAEPLKVGNVEISFLAIYFLHPDEIELKHRDFAALLEAFSTATVTELYDLSRPSSLTA